MLGRAQPIAFVNIIQLRQALVPQVGRLGPGLVPDLLQGRSMWTVEGSIGRSESDVKKFIGVRSRSFRWPISANTGTRVKNAPMSDIGLGLVASQPTHASILLLMACFA
jgi:hypothetical protein